MKQKTVDCVSIAVYYSLYSYSQSTTVLTTMDVRSSLSKRLMAWSNDLYIAAEIRWVMSLFRSIDLPSNWKKKGRYLHVIDRWGKGTLFFF